MAAVVRRIAQREEGALTRAKKNVAAAIEAAARSLAAPIERCAQGWRAHFGRSPRARELVHAFEIVLASHPDRYVVDPKRARALFAPAARPAPLPAASAVRVDVQLEHASWGGLDFADVWLWQRGMRGFGDLRCLFEEADGTLLVDYWVSIYPAPPPDPAIRELLLARAVPAWLAARPERRPSRVVFRAFDSLADPAVATPAAEGRGQPG